MPFCCEREGVCGDGAKRRVEGTNGGKDDTREEHKNRREETGASKGEKKNGNGNGRSRGNRLATLPCAAVVFPWP